LGDHGKKKEGKLKERYEQAGHSDGEGGTEDVETPWGKAGNTQRVTGKGSRRNQGPGGAWGVLILNGGRGRNVRGGVRCPQRFKTAVTGGRGGISEEKKRLYSGKLPREGKNEEVVGSQARKRGIHTHNKKKKKKAEKDYWEEGNSLTNWGGKRGD